MYDVVCTRRVISIARQAACSSGDITPSVLCCAVLSCLQVLVPNSPLTAWFLKPEERTALHADVHGPNAEAASKRLEWREMPRLVLEAAALPLIWYFATAGLSCRSLEGRGAHACLVLGSVAELSCSC